MSPVAANGSSGLFGKFRGTVLNNVDPLALGRLQVKVPEVDATLGWAMPCVPYAGPGVGLYLVPPISANVWVEFEQGNVNYPIWSGCFWATGEVPFPAGTMGPSVKFLTTGSLRLVLDEASGGGTVTFDAGNAKISVSGDSLQVHVSGSSIDVKTESIDVQSKTLVVKAKIESQE